LFQASLGILQSLTGQFGATFQDNRGILGYLGIGSTLVWHGEGTFGHFNSLGTFLSTLLLFYIPINYFLVKNKKKGYIILFILLFGLITTYSRGSLLGLLSGLIFFLFQIQKNKIKLFSILIPLFLIFFITANFLKDTSYITTLSPRNDIWMMGYTVATSNIKNLIFGTGLLSYEEITWRYIPANILPMYYRDFQAHSFYLSHIVEMGIVGLTIIMAFLINNLVIFYKGSQISNNKLLKTLHSSVSLYIFSIFFLGIFDHAFYLFTFRIWLYVMLGIVYAKYKELPKNNI
jgi:O-antigen ligase